VAEADVVGGSVEERVLFQDAAVAAGVEFVKALYEGGQIVDAELDFGFGAAGHGGSDRTMSVRLDDKRNSTPRTRRKYGEHGESQKRASGMSGTELEFFRPILLRGFGDLRLGRNGMKVAMFEWGWCGSRRWLRGCRPRPHNRSTFLARF
jgi:hypothetical protein